MKSLLMLLPVLAFFGTLPACKKDEKDPPLNAAALTAGRAAIRLNSDRNYNGRKHFEVRNTADTRCELGTAGGTTKTIRLEAMELVEGSPSRKVFINILLRDFLSSGNIRVDLASRSGIPQGKIRMESYSLFGITRESVSGSLTVSRFTSAEVEGSFSGHTDDGMQIDGAFAGKF